MPAKSAKKPVPDLIAESERAAFVARAMFKAQEQLLQLRTMQTLNAEGDDAAVPGMEPKAPGAEVPTYKERRAALEDGIKRLWEDNEDVQDQIHALNAARLAHREPDQGDQSTAGG